MVLDSKEHVDEIEKIEKNHLARYGLYLAMAMPLHTNFDKCQFACIILIIKMRTFITKLILLGTTRSA